MVLNTEQETLLQHLKSVISKDLPGFLDCEISPAVNSKNYVYCLKRNKRPVAKARLYPFVPANWPLYELLLKEGVNVPAIIKDVHAKPYIVRFQEWVEGDPLNALSNRNEFYDLKPNVFYLWGKCMAEINNVMNGGVRLSILDIWWNNFIFTGDRVVCCDLAKLHTIVYPETDIFRWVMFNDHMSVEIKKKFTDGYIETRTNLRPDLPEILGYYSEKLRKVKSYA